MTRDARSVAERIDEGVTVDGLEALVQLSLVRGVGPRTMQMLLQQFVTPERVLQASLSELERVEGVGGALSHRIAAVSDGSDARAEIELCRQNDIAIQALDLETYPVRLREIPDPPMVLFQQGTFLDQDALALAIVGTRHASRYGLRQAERLSRELARAGFTIVSGLARGIDAAAHRAALDAGGRTVAVLGSGLLNVYPPEHRSLAQRIGREGQGILLSESPPLRPPMSGTFPQRNRLISGLALGVIVIEAAERSGALITASHASEQGRDVFAVPGRIDQATSRGCHRLIQDGARLVQSVDDVLDELGPLPVAARTEQGLAVRHPAELQLNDQELQVLVEISEDPTSIDYVVRHSGLPIHRVLATLSVLEMKKLVRRLSGQYVARI